VRMTMAMGGSVGAAVDFADGGSALAHLVFIHDVSYVK